MIKDTKEWIDALRETLQVPAAPLQQRNGRWEVRDRKAAWLASGPRIFDQDLDRLKKVAIEVLTERGPEFELKPDNRFAAHVHGKVLKHSTALRHGLAETLALLGAFPDALPNVSFDKARVIAVLTVRGILTDADWQLWATLNNELPLLAEAAPEEFMSMVEAALDKKPSPFREVYAQEDGGALGRTYMTGLLWALEGLAWSEEYLVRVAVILGGLASIDPGGQWTNRPSNSLVEIFLPWLPHTTASTEQRVNAVKALLKNHPGAGWHLLVSLLPNGHRTSSETHKPAWRKLIADTWKRGVTNKEYWDQSEIYAALALAEATKFDRLLVLVQRVAELPPNVKGQLLEKLRAEVLRLDGEEHQAVWSELLTITTRHKKFASADWAMSADQIVELEKVAELFKPVSPVLEFKRLFGQGDYEYYDEKTDLKEQEKRLDERRVKAVEAVFAEGGIPRLVTFAHEVETPWKLGLATGWSAIAAEPDFLPTKLSDDASPESNLIRGFVWGRFHTQGWAWIDRLGIEKWSELQCAQLLAMLPFEQATWERAEKMLPDQGQLYWQRTDANAYRAKTGLNHAIGRLLDNGRAIEAISCLYYQIHNRQKLDAKLAVRALRELLKNQDRLERSRDAHDVLDVIKALQGSTEVPLDDMFEIEWRYLPLLDEFRGGSPVFLAKRLATDPAFFCEIICLLYRAKDVPAIKPEELDEGRKRIAEVGYKLLHNWRLPPGLNDDGTLDAAKLKTWVATVEKLCAESGRLEVARTHIGHVLMRAPADPSGLWINKAAAEILNAENAEDMRSGYECEWFNSRGAHFGTGGKDELKLATDFKQKAAAVEAEGFVRLGTTLRDLAKSYEFEAARDALGGPLGTM